MPLATLIFVAKLIFFSWSSSMCRLWPRFSLLQSVCCTLCRSSSAQTEGLVWACRDTKCFSANKQNTPFSRQCKLDVYNTHLNPSLFSAYAVFLRFFSDFVFKSMYSIIQPRMQAKQTKAWSISSIWYLSTSERKQVWRSKHTLSHSLRHAGRVPISAKPCLSRLLGTTSL